MHGLIANQLRSYTLAHHSREAWTHAVEACGNALPDGPVPLGLTYHDADVMAVVLALSRETDMEVPVLLEEFGAYLAGGLLRVYHPLVPGAWRTLDVIQHAEEHIHTAVRLRDSSAGPPYLTASRRSPTSVEVIYTSPRRLCALATGIVHGMATHYGEVVRVEQPECMLRGDARCLLQVELLPADAP